MTKTAPPPTKSEGHQQTPDILAKAHAVVSEFDAWAVGDNPNDQRKLVPLYTAASAFAKAWADVVEVPADCARFLRGFCRFAEAVIANERQHENEFQRPRHEREFAPPSRAFESAVRELALTLAAPKPAPLAPLESVMRLDGEGVGHHQISRMYGFIDSRGEPEAWKIEEELKSPGKWVNENWVDPRRQAAPVNTNHDELLADELRIRGRQAVRVGNDWASSAYVD
ncbi:MAG TPA: hypothetical protein VGG64_21055 [Pirellulales bacterium]|jgi:hypothetical protein